MDDVRASWSLFPWMRYEDDDRLPGIPGAAIYDSRKQVTYRATVDAQERLDHLEIEMHGHIDDARLDRLRSIPRERIEVAVADFVRNGEPGSLQFVLEGGLLAGDESHSGGVPPYADVARLMAKGWNRGDLALRYFPDHDPEKAVRRVDRWIARARKLHPDIAPRPSTGARYRSNRAPEGTASTGQQENGEKQ